MRFTAIEHMKQILPEIFFAGIKDMELNLKTWFGEQYQGTILSIAET